MYVKQAKAQSQNVKLQKKRTYYPGRGKYGWSGYFKVCTYCGDNGHKQYECAAKQYCQPRASRQYNLHANNHQARPTNVQKHKARQPNVFRVLNPNVLHAKNAKQTQAASANDTNYIKPKKANMVWVPKTLA